MSITDMGVVLPVDGMMDYTLIRVASCPSPGQYVFRKADSTYLFNSADFGKVEVHYIELGKECTKVSMRCHCLIVGAQYHPGGPEQLKRLADLKRKFPDMPIGLELRREPENPHDRNAVAVWCRFRKDGRTQEQHLGYVPRGDAKAVAKVMDAGVQVRARFVAPGTMELFWPASTKEGVDEAYRRAIMLEFE